MSFLEVKRSCIPAMILFVAGCASHTGTDIGVKLLQTAGVIVEDVLPHLARTEATEFASLATRQWNSLEQHIGRQAAIALAEELRQFRQDQIARLEFLVLEQEVKIELMKGKTKQERTITDEKIALLRMKVFQKAGKVLVTSAIDFLDTFASELEESR